MCHRFIRGVFGALALVAASLVSAQNLEIAWRQESSYDWSSYANGSFAPGDRTVFVRNEEQASITCVGPDGITEWDYPVATGESISHILSTTDNYVLAAGSNTATANGRAFILALRLDGSFAWRYDLDKRADISETLNEMRIFGNNILAVGNGKPTANGPEPRSCLLVSIDRFTGAENYVRGYTPDGLETGGGQIRSGAGFAFLRTFVPYPGDAGAILKIDPANGNVAGSYSFDYDVYGDFAVDSLGGIYQGGSNLEKINGSGVGTFPLVYRRPISSQSFILSGGALFVLGSDGLRRVNPVDGITIWLNTDYRYQGYEAANPTDLLADVHGRLFVKIEEYWYSGWAGEYYLNGYWDIETVNPVSGQFLNSYGMGSSYGEPDPYPGAFGHILLGPYGEILSLGTFVGPPTDPFWWTNTQHAEARRFYQSPEPVADTYALVQGSTFTTSGNGVLANDRYTNPSRAQAILVTAPAAGTLTLQSNGEFTYHSAGAPVGSQTFIYRVVRGALSATAQVTLNISRGLSDLTLARYTLAGQNATLGTVILSSAGPAATVALSDNSSLVAVPTSVTVPANQSTKTFGVSVVPVSVPVVTQITATYAGTSKIVSLTLTPLIPTAIALTPSTVVGGNSVSVRVVINGVAGSTGKVLAISDNSAYCLVPSAVTVPAGATSVTFNATTTRPITQQIVQIKASVTAGSATATLRINP